ncbi:hypothetical protein BC834DRAFT_33707 [Gloeopeniophorella convolvens]|nr:hypothetical protein BC834DRAFT_33707 [Gloeopeniophorella convolvens]
MSATRPKLPSVLQSQPAVQDASTTQDQVNTGLARATNPTEYVPRYGPGVVHHDGALCRLQPTVSVSRARHVPQEARS